MSHWAKLEHLEWHLLASSCEHYNTIFSLFYCSDMRKEKYVAQIALAAALYGANRLFPIDKIGTVINF